SGVSATDMVDRLTGLAQRVDSVDDRYDLAGLDQHTQNNQVLLVRRHDEGRQALAYERKRHLRADKGTPAGDPPMVEAPAVRHEHPPWGEGTSQVGQCVVRHVVEDEVVTLARPREVLFGVIDDMV